MRYWVGITDNEWFSFLENLRPDEVNFWRPSGRGFSALEIGAPFLFKLHSPLNYVVGGGFFVRAERLPRSLAWEAFEGKNGARNQAELTSLIQNYTGSTEVDPEIGCIIGPSSRTLQSRTRPPGPEGYSQSSGLGGSGCRCKPCLSSSSHCGALLSRDPLSSHYFTPVSPARPRPKCSRSDAGCAAARRLLP